MGRLEAWVVSLDPRNFVLAEELAGSPRTVTAEPLASDHPTSACARDATALRPDQAPSIDSRFISNDSHSSSAAASAAWALRRALAVAS